MIIISRRKFIDRCVRRSEIKEEMKLIEGSNTDYITPSGKIYKDYGNDLFYPKKIIENNHNHYLYVSITYSDGINRTRRHHILLAKAFIPNPNNYPIVGHKDNNKSNNTLDNLYWTTWQENTQKAVDDGLMVNDKSYDDSQSMPVIMFDAYTNQEIGRYGSVHEAHRETQIGINTILNQAKYKKPIRKNFYFRFQNDKNINPPRIIVQYDFYTHDEIGRYYNTWEAERQTGINSKTIGNQCKRNKIPKWTKSKTYFLYLDRSVS